jgi:sigma-B regulation protein RsbU (phosphoserine phosphatase)
MPQSQQISDQVQRSGVMQLAMVVDDSKLQRRILSASLKKWGFEVVEASSGPDAIEKCKERLPDLVLSDWVMPGMSGLQFCREFRTLSETQYGYFILLTSKSEKAEVAKGLDSGADDFLSKPVDVDELRARISAGERILEMQRQLIDKNLIITHTLDELQRVYDLLDKDLIEAKKLQQSLVRERTRDFDGGKLSLLLRSSGHVGGDLVGFFPVNDTKLGLFGIDVSGHGISSALMTARLAGYLSAAVPDQNIALVSCADGTFSMRPPDEVVRELNALVLSEMETEHYFTLLMAEVDLDTGNVLICQAGHPHPVVQRRDGQIEQDGLGGFPVGLLAGVEYEKFQVNLSPGDRLLILSDGVTECPDPSGIMIEEEGLAEMLFELRDVTGPPLLEAIVWKLSEFAGHADFPDDVSGILFEFTGR